MIDRRLAVCASGRIGVVTMKKGGIYHGRGLFDGTPWQSKNPRFIATDDINAIANVMAVARVYIEETEYEARRTERAEQAQPESPES